ncbi:serine/threonine-protein kinase Nek4 isoform X2 [Nerophis ophidion]|uniref:serine/threonine-protein kinase Nek4 isoform X2 n=2 Tax=Nerophis ophidion TaxID=159077 RepID=UPI002ADF7264|nr:serine/threonine-protein kinase Nek4 isoform X2 [Nerophis ophidion]
MDNYVFIRVVGKGSYGEVNLVKHKADKKQYVIKKLNLTTSSKRERRSAEQEAQLLSQLRHPNIVTYRESWEGVDLQLYIVMGFCEGGDLYHRLKQQKGELLPERQVVEWFVQIAMALEYLHKRNILHRDLKTQNIFLTKTNIIKVGDLGIARVLENQNDMASTLIGTPYYMSPELLSNKPYNHKSDVWALGCCVYEMSTLKHAFNAKDMNSLVYRIVGGKLPQMPIKYDPQLGEMIKNMLCKKPEDRPDVNFILRQPYIKRQIAIFLEATKVKTAKSRKKVAGGSNDIRNNNAANVATPQPRPPSPRQEAPPRLKQKSKLQHSKNVNGPTDGNSVQVPPPPKSPSPDVLKSCVTLLATVSNVQIDIPPQEDADFMKRQVEPPHAEKKDASLPPTHNKPPLKCVLDRRPGDKRKVPNGFAHIYPLKETFCVPENKAADIDLNDNTLELLREANMPNPKLEDEQEAALENRSARIISTVNAEGNKNGSGTRSPTQHENIQENLETKEELLEALPPTVEPIEEECPSLINTPGLNAPFVTTTEPVGIHQQSGRSKGRTNGVQEMPEAAAPRPLPPPPASETAATEVRKRNKDTESKKANARVIPKAVYSSGDGPFLIPQERPLSARERRRLRQSQDTTCQSGASRASYDVTASKAQRYISSGTSSVSDVTTETTKQEKMLEQRMDKECNSSTSSTEHSEGDGRERKAESKDMQDLVHMMTQTLRMVSEDRELGSSALPEFKLNRKYRDTLVLHGKARQEAENLSLGEIPLGSSSGPAKIRRAIEILRTDVVKGLGVKLLDKVLEIMEEEDDIKREVCLRQQMGDEKYQNYAVMVRQLKFFEEIAFKV